MRAETREEAEGEADAVLRKETSIVDEDVLRIPAVVLEWSEWTAWDRLKIGARSGPGVSVPNRKSGVYEVRRAGDEERLTIGRASNLRRRIKQGLVKGKTKHSTGTRIRASEDTSRLVVRWATTDIPAAAEEELHRRHKARFGRLPEYARVA